MDKIFTENEKISIALLMTQMLVADKKIVEQELKNKYELSKKYGIPLSIPEDCDLNFEKAQKVIKELKNDKKNILLNILQKLAESDADFAYQEKMILEDLFSE